MYELLTVVMFIAVLIASYTDIRTREVPDWLNYSLIAAGLGIRGVISIVYLQWEPIVFGLLGLLAMFLFALLMFQTGQWGGGDSKLLMGIGAVIGLEFSWPPMILIFLLLLVVLGAFYGMLWSIFIALKNLRAFKKQFKALMSQKSYLITRRIILLITILVLISVFFVDDLTFKFLILSSIALIFFGFYTWVAIKSIELSCMQKFVFPEQLTEGDWIVKDVKVNGKYICGPKDLGIEKNQITQLIKLKKQGKIKKILIKEGIPFVPSFLLALIATLYFDAIMIFLKL